MTPQTRADVRVILIMVLIVLVFMLFAGRYARAATAPAGITCEHVKQAAALTGQKDPSAIARTIGLKLTEAQRAEAAKCLRRER